MTYLLALFGLFDLDFECSTSTLCPMLPGRVGQMGKMVEYPDQSQHNMVMIMIIIQLTHNMLHKVKVPQM